MMVDPWGLNPTELANPLMPAAGKGISSIPFFANVPVKLPDAKKSVADFIVKSADIAHNLYKRAERLADKYPFMKDAANSALSVITDGVRKVTDLNPSTMGWGDLTSIWLFELGDRKTIEFGPEARTTKDVKGLEGVQTARKEAEKEAEQGHSAAIERWWPYGQKEFYEGIKEGNVVTSFLGSYDVKVVVVPVGDGSFVLNYTVSNTTGWESGTRLRRDNDCDGVHDSVIPAKERTVGIRLGGNLKQEWKWSETYTPKAKK